MMRLMPPLQGPPVDFLSPLQNPNIFPITTQ